MTAPGSLIQAAAAADRLAPPFSFFVEVQEEANKSLAAAGEFSGERLFRDRPAVYAAAVRMIAEGQSISATARALGISRNTVCAVRDREGVSIEQEKKELLRDLRRASRLGVEKVLELLPETKAAKDAAIVSAVMMDKMQLLSGEATSRIERVEAKPDQVKAFLDALPVVEAEVLEVVSIGVPGQTPGQKADELKPAVPALPVPLSDSVSDDLRIVPSVKDGRGTNARTKEIGLAGASCPDVDGGGGGPVCSTPVPGVIDSETQNFGQSGQSVAAPNGDEAGCGDSSVAGHLCKSTKKKQGGRKPVSSPRKALSKKARISAKKKGGSAC